MSNFRKILVLIGFIALAGLVGCGEKTSNPAGPVIPTQLASAQKINDNIVGTWKINGSETDVEDNLIIVNRKWAFTAANTVVWTADVLYDSGNKQYWEITGKYTVTEGQIEIYNTTAKIYTVDSGGLKTFQAEMSNVDEKHLVTEISSTKLVTFYLANNTYETSYKQ